MTSAAISIPAGLPDAFSRSAFEAAFAAEASGPHAPSDIRKALQALKRKGLIAYDGQAKLWRKTDAAKAGASQLPVAPLKAASKTPLHARRRKRTVLTVRTPFERAIDALRLALSALVCFAAVAALVAINASFAWALGENDAFRVAFVAGLAASDLMRPLLIARGLWDYSRRKVIRGTVAIAVALALAPVSILSSTSAISATLLLGAEENADDAMRAAALSALRPAYEARKVDAEEARRAVDEECARGGCGPVAARLEEAAEAVDADLRAMLTEIAALTGQTSGQSGFIARTVASFEAAGLYGPDRKLLAPLLLALTLEMAALFGPGLLLARR